MMVVVVYDVSQTDDGSRRLRHVAARLERVGQRVQYSTFECLVTPGEFEMLRHDLLQIIDTRYDSLRFYFLGKNWKRNVEHIGAKASYDPESALIF